MGGWSMGWDVKDAHQSVTDDGRTLRPIPEDEYVYFGGISEMPALVPPSKVLVSCARSEGERYQAASAHLSGQKLIFLDLKNAASPRSGLGSL